MKPTPDPQMGPLRLDAKAVRRSFDTASGSYDAAAVLQKEVRTRLLGRLDFVVLQPEVVVDLGAGTGHASKALKARFPRAQVVAVDLAPGMLAEARHQLGWRRRFDRLCADAAQLPFKDQSVDLIVSNLMLQWCTPPDAVLAEIQRVLKPRGLFSFTSFGPDTLHELRSAWAEVDARPHVHQFVDMHDLGDALMRARLAEPVLDVEQFTLTYQNATALMRELKLIGARNAMQGRGSGLTGRRRMQALQNAYESFRQDGVLPATYEVVYGQAWGTGSVSVGHRQDGEVRVAVENIGVRHRE